MSHRMLSLGILAAVMLGAFLNRLTAEGPTKTEPRKLALQPSAGANAEPESAKAVDRKTPSSIQFSSAKAPTEAEIREALDTPVEVDFDDDHLNVILKQLEKTTGTNIWIDEQALAEEGIGIDTRLTLKGKPIAAARVLDRLLDPLDLRWLIQDHVVQITTSIAAEEILVTRTYPVGDLLEYAKQHPPEEVAVKRISRLEMVQLGGLHPGCYGGGYVYPESPANWLMVLLQNHTSGPWLDVDGTGGSMSLLNNTLTVRQTHRIQVDVEKILDTVRQFAQDKLQLGTVEIRPPHYSSEDDEAINKALAKVISLKCQQLPLKTFVTDFGSQLGVPIWIDDTALNEEGVSLDEPLSIDLKNLPTGSLLNLVFTPLALTAIVEDGRLVITTIIAAEERLYTVMHDISDLKAPQFDGQALLNLLESETSGDWGNVDGTGGNIDMPLPGLLSVWQTQRMHREVAGIIADLRKENAAHPQAPATPKPDPQGISLKFYTLPDHSDTQGIREAVLTLVEPNSWAKNGGTGEIVLMGNQLIVKTRNEIHSQVQDFLKKCQQAAYPDFSTGMKYGGGSFSSGSLGSGGMSGATPAGGSGFFRIRNP